MFPIDKPRSFLFRQKNLDSFIAAALGFAIIHLFTSYNGIGVSPDSVIYTSVAKDLLKGQGFTEFDGEPMTMFPFFYPAFLAAVSFLTHIEIIKLAPFLNSFLFALVIYLCGRIMEKFNYSFKYYKWIIFAFFITSPSLLEVFSMLWSETLFTLLIILFFISGKKYFSSGHKLKHLLFFSMVAAIANITRFAGITLIAAGAVFLLLDRNLYWKKKILHLIIFGALSISLLAINLIRNRATSGGFTGHRLKSITPFLENMRYYGNVIYDWLQLHTDNYNGNIIVGALAFILIGGFLLFQLFKKKYTSSYENMAAIYCIVYMSFIIFSATISRYETINNRLLEPAYIPFIWSASYFVMLLLQRIKKQQIRFGAIVFFLFLSGLFLYQQVLTAKHMYKDILDDGIAGYTSKSYQASPIIQWIETKHNTLNPAYPIYSNVNDCMYFFTGVPAQAIPDAARNEEVQEYLISEPHYIIWFGSEEVENPNKFSLKTIEKFRHLDTLKQFSDGGVYWCGYKK